MKEQEPLMKCPKCGSSLSEGAAECSRCGIIIAKFLARREIASLHSSESCAKPESSGRDGRLSQIKELLFHVEPGVNIFYFVGRLIVFLAMFFWGWKFITSSVSSNYAGQSILHLVNLPFHEAGHILFRPFGRFMTVLGGSVLQVLIPLICFAVFLFRTRDVFAASVALWWTGESLMDLAPYINDARDLKLILLGGITGRDVADYHDWEFILRTLGLLRADHVLAGLVHIAGIALMLCTFVWAGIVLCRQFRSLDI